MAREARDIGSGHAPGEPGAADGSGALGDELAALRPRLTAVAMRFARSRDAADDIVQSAFEKAIRNLAQFRGSARLSTWLHRIVVNESLMWLRAEGRRQKRLADASGFEWEEPPWVEPSPDAAQQLALAQQHARLRAGVAALPAREREVLQRCALEEVSYEQYAAESGIRPAAAKSRAFRGRQRLRRLLVEPS